MRDSVDHVYLRDIWLVGTGDDRDKVCAKCKYWERDLDKVFGVCGSGDNPEVITSEHWDCKYFEKRDE